MKKKRNINPKRKSTIYRVKLTNTTDVLVEVYLYGKLFLKRFFRYKDIQNKKNLHFEYLNGEVHWIGLRK